MTQPPTVVIGLGGSGMQTVARIRSRVDATPDAGGTVLPLLLGIDRVGLDKQHPPLPPGVSLRQAEFVNLLSDPLDPAKFLAAAADDDTLRASWHDPYVPGRELHRSRMLGRLAFHWASETVTAALEDLIGRAASLRPLDAQGVPSLRVHLIASCHGDTGSAGVLDVLYRVCAAANRSGFRARTSLFLLGPGVFEGAVLTGPSPMSAIRRDRANAYAFLRELDHFGKESSRLEQFMHNPELDLDLRDGDLFDHVFVVNDDLIARSRTNVTAVYDDLADVISQITSSDLGARLLHRGTFVVDHRDVHRDRFDKDQRYCGIGRADVPVPTSGRLPSVTRRALRSPVSPA